MYMYIYVNIIKDKNNNCLLTQLFLFPLIVFLFLLLSWSIEALWLL